MARHWFGRGAADWTFDTGAGDTVVLAPGVTLTFWNQATGGVQYTDLLDEGGDPIEEVVTSDGTGLPKGTVPRFKAPDGVTVLWADSGAGSRVVLNATDLGDDVASLIERVTALETLVAEQQTLLSYALYGLKYDAGSGSYPAVPTELAGQQYLFWIGPPVPTAARARDIHIDTPE